MAKNDLTGQRFERLVVIQDTGVRKNECVMWECKCDCGETVIVSSANLRHGRTKSCGCLIKEARKQPKMKKIPVRIAGIEDLTNVNNFSDLRAKTGASQNWFAEYFGIAPRSVQSWEQKGMGVRGIARAVFDMMKRILVAEANLRSAWMYAADLGDEPEFAIESDVAFERCIKADELKSAESIFALRSATGWDQTQFADVFSINVTSLAAWENGRNVKLLGMFDLMKRTIFTETILRDVLDFVSVMKSSEGAAATAEFKKTVQKMVKGKLSEMDVFDYTKSVYSDIWYKVTESIDIIGEEIADMDLTNYLRDRRLELGLSQGDVAKALCVDPASISKWESGKNGVRGKYLIEYAKLLETTPAVIQRAIHFAAPVKPIREPASCVLPRKDQDEPKNYPELQDK